MPRKTTAFELTLEPPHDGEPEYRWLYSELRNEILAGRLAPGTRIPATRDLAAQYRISRGTVVRAFEELKAEGYLEGSVGSGTYVSRLLPEALLEIAKRTQPVAGARITDEPRVSAYARRVRPFPSYEPRSPRAFRAHVPALDLFPMKLWAQLAGRRLRSFSVNALAGCEAAGFLPLRRALAGYLAASRGVKCSAEQIFIVWGAQQALDLAARLLLDPGDRVAMEDPGYVGAATVFAAFGADVRPVAVDGEGLRVDERNEINMQAARLVYTTPAHQFPLGVTMSLARRLALLDWAKRADALIFEDDYDSEYRYSGRPIPALQGLDRNERVIFAGTFSKVLFPSLRLGYMVVPERLVDRLAALQSATSRHAGVPDQAVLADFIEQGHFGRHLRRMRQVYGERFRVLLEEGRRELAGLIELSPIEAGLQTCGWLADGLEEQAVVKAAAARGVELEPLGRYSIRGLERPGVHLGFAAVDERKIRRGVRELARAIAHRPID